RLLEQASMFGEGVAVSMLTGSAEVDENRVLQFLDRAEALGLVSRDFERNDEVMRFLSKRVLEISYGAMDESRRQALHEQVGTYQEGLYQQRVLPSASMLAYHFKRSANEQKALRYEQAQRGYAQTVFDPLEAARYKVEDVEEEAEAEGRLAPESVALVPSVLRAFMAAVRSLQLYPPESKTIPQSLEQLWHSLQEILERNAWLHLSQDRHVLLANSQRLELSEWSALAGSFLELLDRSELQGLTFDRGVTEAELKALLLTLVGTKPAAMAPGFWKRTAAERGLTHVKPQQVRYSKTVRIRAARLLDQEQELSPDELAVIPRILRALQTAAKMVKLYPPDAEPVTRPVEQLHAALRDVVKNRPSLTLAGVEHALLANGVRVDTAGYETVASGVVDLLAGAALQSVTVYADVQVAEVAAFLGALRDFPPSGGDDRYWVEVGRREGLTGISFNQRHYAVSAVQRLLREMSADDQTASEADTDAAAVERLVAEPLEALRQALPRFGRELLVKGEHVLVRGLLRRLFDGFPDQDPAGRVRTVQACHLLFSRLIFGVQHKYAELAAGFLLTALAGETDPQALGEFGDLLYAMAGNAVQLGDYQLASRILTELRARQDQLREAGGREAKSVALALNGRLDAAALRLLDEDMRSGEADRAERAAQVLEVLGVTGIPLLIDVIKQESGFRVRQLAAKLVVAAGPTGAQQIKRALATEVLVDPRARLLEVIDTVTRDLWHELQQCLLDDSPKIRRAAFQLFDRLRQDDLIDLILPLAHHSDPWVVRAAIHALTALRSTAGVRALSSILQATREPSHAVLCCQALGQSDDEAAIEALAHVLRAHKFLLFGRRWRTDVRVAAAMALKQIPRPRAADVLARYAHDLDAWVQQLAQG
ncbi:MAG TPA: HEAT repeat domain-containing protein, partial [Gemmatimonadales bacterium]|nr:HEAT repeat domain-containing protein [Gemmatimonadales bacterium]